MSEQISKTEVVFALVIITLLFWGSLSMMRAAYASATAPEPVKMCVTPSGHKRVPCP